MAHLQDVLEYLLLILMAYRPDSLKTWMWKNILVMLLKCGACYLRYIDKLGENLGSELRCRPTEHHELYPLGDTIAQCNGALHRGVL